MSTQKISTSLSNLIHEVAEDRDITIHKDYSGRFMYGDTCFGLSFEGSAGEMFSAFIYGLKWKPHITGELADMFSDMRSDNLGLGTIFYFPGWKFNESEAEDEDSEDEDWDDEEESDE